MTKRVAKPKVSRWLQMSAAQGKVPGVIPLTQGKYALVDEDYWEWLSGWKWTLFTSSKGRLYAYRKQGTKSILMHRQIMQPPTGLQVDHVNGDGLDNRRRNLRLCTAQQNAFNSKSKVGRQKCVHFCKTTQRWIAKIRVGRKIHHLGQFMEFDQAVVAYKLGAERLHGEFAWRG